MSDDISYNHTVTELFEQQVLATPQYKAVAYNSFSLTYQQLNEKSNQFAHWLIAQGLKKNDFVALLLEPSVEFIVCILGIIKAGGVYLPLDILSPCRRLQEILNDAQPHIFITHKSQPELTQGKWATYLISALEEKTTAYPTQNLSRLNNPEDPIYMMYTSGSTGKPKGIVIPHQAVVNLVKTVNYAGLQPREIIAQFSNLAFDASTFEIWSALLHGANISIIPSPARQDYLRLETYIFKNKIQYLFLPTGYFHQIIQFYPKVLNQIKVLIFGGEQINVDILNTFITYRTENALPMTLINGYGPTEAAVFTCRCPIEINFQHAMNTDKLNTIGKAIPNVTLYVLNEALKPVTPGEIGELYISGINLGLGYQNNTALNQERFIQNPFSRQYPYSRLYKTGDLVKQLPDGNIVYIGRADDQVKVNGFRVSLNEIENRLLQHPAVRMASVIAEKDNGVYTKLHAYIVFFENQVNITSHDLKQHLATSLPRYMHPLKYRKINQLPLTSAGKVDKKQLSLIDSVNLEGINIKTSPNSVEKKLKKIWENLLHTNNLDVTKNLFDLGADSFLILEACKKISEEFHYVCHPAFALTHTSIRKLSRHLEQHVNTIPGNSTK